MKPLLTNRLLMGMAVFLLLVAVWEFGVKAQHRPYYHAGVRYYEQKDYARALASFEQAYAIAPNAAEVVTMLGWTTFHLGRYDESRYYFQRALRLAPLDAEARRGAALAEERLRSRAVPAP
jgi:tetratricopeptide (TPR) repeat protein